MRHPYDHALTTLLCGALLTALLVALLRAGWL